MAVTRLVFIRHAQMDCRLGSVPLLCGSHDVCLSTRGLEQVKRLREKLRLEPPASALYSSPLRRAAETAAAAPPQLFRRMRLLNSLAEIHCGVVEGRPINEIQQRFPSYWTRNEAQDDDSFRWPGGESYSRFRRRILRAVRAIASRHPEERVLIFTHAGVITQVLGFLNGQRAARWEHPRPHNCSLTEVLWDDGSFLGVERYNDCEFLRDAA